MKRDNAAGLRQQLIDLDRRSYKAYKDIQGSYKFPDFTLIIEHVQGDPFASPSKLRVKIPQNIADFPKKTYSSASREVALRDYLTREFRKKAHKISSRRGTGNSGTIEMVRMGQTVLPRTAVNVDDDYVEARFLVGLPAQGRRILGKQAAELLCDDIAELVDETLKYDALDAEILQKHVETVEDADWLRSQLEDSQLVAFIPNGAILPRRSGVDDRPLAEGAIPFQSPESLQVEFSCPNRGTIEGMGIPTGITLVVGGGYHGKSTLLNAIETGIYNHIPSDGRELVVTHPDALKVRAEDGRSVSGVDISPFINDLPQGRSTTQFSTANASGSTSQAANIVEAVEAGGKVLLVDEDTAATNFMIRDRRMQELIAKNKEPITPFIDKVRLLYQDLGVSVLLVMGGSGDYFDIADRAIAMENFLPYDVTDRAKAIAAEYATGRESEGGEMFGKISSRIIQPNSLDPSSGKRDVKVKVRDVDAISFGKEDIDLSSVEQIAESSQLRAIAAALVYLKQEYVNGKLSLAEILDRVMADVQEQGLDVLTRFPEGDLAEFRRLELAAAINRLRTLQVCI